MSAEQGERAEKPGKMANSSGRWIGSNYDAELDRRTSKRDDDGGVVVGGTQGW